ncbi:MAG: glycosyltransferase, partial [Anaerolineae bacterium]|nr:glycosyltransferase [Anaerolineae bacterium]
MLTVLQTHPIQYQAPVYRHLQQKLNIPITVIYGSDFSVVGYHDAEFDVSFSWDSNLLSGYDSRFLTTVKNGGADSPQKLAGTGIADALADIRPTAVLLTGYGFPFHRAAFRQAKRCGYPLLLRGETTDADQSRGGIKKIIRDAVLRWYYSQFTALLPIGVNSNAHYDRLASANTPRFFSPYCIDTTPFATSEVDRAHYRGATRQRLNLKDDQQVILFSGKLIDKKAPELLLESIKRLPTEERKKRTILFLGDGPLRSVLAAMAEAEPTVHVHFLGFQNQSALSPYYHAADLL